MSTRKMKHKRRFWVDDAAYGDQMRHFISGLGSRRPAPDEIRYCDID